MKPVREPLTPPSPSKGEGWGEGLKAVVLGLLLLLTAGLAAAPEAQAAWGSVGSILTKNDGTAGTSWSPTGGMDAQLDAGNVGVCVLATDETGSGTTDGDNNQHTTVTDAASNTWIQAREWAIMRSSTAANGANVSIWYTLATTNLAAAATITFNLSASTTRKAATCWEFTITAGASVSVAAGGNGLSNIGADPGSMTVATGASGEYLFIRAVAGETNNTGWTSDTDYVAFDHTSSTSNSGTPATSMGARGEQRIATEATSLASDPTWVVADMASAMVALKEVVTLFSYRKAITIDHTKVGNSGATTLTDYPFLFNVTDANLKTVANGGHVTDEGSGGAIAIDGTPTSAAATTAQTTLTWSHTTGAGTNRILLVGVSIRNLLDVTVTGVKYNTIPLSLAGPGSAANGTIVRAYLWQLVNPPTGTFTVEVTLSAAQRMAAGAISFTGVDQTTPIDASNSATGVSGTPSVTVTTVADNAWVVDVLAFRRGSGTATEPTGTPTGTGQTQQWSGYMDSGDTADMRSKGSTVGPKSPAGGVTMSWNLSVSTDWAHYAVSLKPAAGGGGSGAGSDIIFRALDATTCNDLNDVCTLDHEIEQYDPATGKFVAWVRIPTIKAFSYGGSPVDTVIYIYYGNSEITTSTENPTGVWNSNYVSVWHLNQDPSPATSIECSGSSSANVVCDSTANNKDADPFNMAAAALVSEPTAKIAKALIFDGVDDYGQVTDADALTIGGTGSVFAWVKPTSSTNYRAAAFKNDEYWLGFNTGTYNPRLNSHNGTGWIGGLVAPSAVTANEWHQIGLVLSGTSRRLYVDGVEVASDANNGTAANTANNLLIGDDPLAGPGLFVGGIDEVRISNIARDAHWITTEYKNMNLSSCRFGTLPFLASDFSVCDAEESNPPSAVKLRGARAIAYEGAYAQTVQLKWRTSHEVDHLGFYVYREQADQLLRVTPSIVAGSALLARGRTELTAGQRYSWWDVLPTGGGPLQYWLEEVDIHGQRTWHGPIAVTSAKGRRDLAKPEQVRSVLLSKLGRGKHKGRLPGAPWQGSTDAATQTPTAAQLAVQAQLAAGPAIKLGVSAEGWYRVDQPTLIAVGLDPKVDPRRLKLFADGWEVPMIVTGAKDERLEPRDAIGFYGVGLETPWTDTRTYWLVAGSQAGQRIGASQWQGRAQAGPASFPYTVTWQPRELYFAALRNGEADNFFGPVVGNWPTEQAFTLNHLDPAPPSAARLEVTLQGVTDGPHAVDVQVNGTSVGTVTFNGQGQGQAALSVPSSQLQPGANVVTLMALGGEMDISLVATVRLTYWHSYTAEEDVLRGSVAAGQQVTIGGFSTKPIHVVDVTEPDAVRAVPGRVTRQGSSFAITVVGPGPGTRTLLAFTDRIAATPAKIYSNQPSQWNRSGHRADLVMIGHPAFLPSLATLKAWREQQGLRVALIDVEDLYDEFTFGAKSPWALRALMETARTRWAQPPRFLLLGGDASFDPRDTQMMGETDFVPTKLIDTDMMETASDDWFGDLNGDGVPEVAVGRLAVRTAEEAATVVQKLIGYDQTAAPRTAVLVADTADSLDFEGASTRLAALLPSGMATQAIYRSQSDDATTRGALLAALNSGAWLVNYLGHGSVEVWRGEVFTSLDASTLTNGLRLPFVSTMTCLNGFFHDVWTESLAEALQRAPQGGALAVWASSSLSQAAEQVDMNRALLKGLSAGRTLGDAVAQAKAVARDRNVRRTWILFGDPTTRLR